MSRKRNTFAKRKREMDKKLKAEEKRARKLRKKEADEAPPIMPEAEDELAPEAPVE